MINYVHDDFVTPDNSAADPRYDAKSFCKRCGRSEFVLDLSYEVVRGQERTVPKGDVSGSWARGNCAPQLIIIGMSAVSP